MDDSKHLRKLKEITGKLPPPLLTTFTEQASAFIEYQVSGGMAFGRKLWYEKELGVQLLTMSKGTKFPRHTHEEVEIGILIEGSVTLVQNSEKCELKKPGDMLRLVSGQKHEAEVHLDSRMLFITIPANEGYPK